MPAKAVVAGAAGFLESGVAGGLVVDGIEVACVDSSDRHERRGPCGRRRFRGKPGSVYNVGGGERVEPDRALRLIEGITARPLRTQHEETQTGDMRDTFADTAAAVRELGLRSRVSRAEGLAARWERPGRLS